MNRLKLLPTILAALAYLATLFALIGFGQRAHGYPLHWRALGLYGGAVALMVLCVIALVWRGRRATEMDTLTLVLLSTPALAGVALAAAVWLSAAWGGAPFAPYDMQDTEAVWAMSLVPAAVLGVIGIVYGRPSVALLVGGAPVLVYFGAYALPNWLRWSEASLLGGNPQLGVQLLLILALCLVAAYVRGRLWPQWQPGPALAVALSGLVGGWLLFGLFSALPGNGDYLGYLAAPGASAGLTVPANAWDGLRPAALVLAALAVVSSLALPLLTQAWPWLALMRPTPAGNRL